MVVRGSPQTIPSPSLCQWKKGGWVWGFLLLLHFSLFLIVYLCLISVSSASLSLCLLIAAFCSSVSIPLLYLCLYVSLSSCQTFSPANIKHSPPDHAPSFPCSPNPSPVSPHLPPSVVLHTAWAGNKV